MDQCGGLVVSAVPFYSYNLSSNPSEVYSFFFCKMRFENNENNQKGRVLKYCCRVT